ncbi:hypothetical protein [Blastopirellula marina]|uniref:Uncharacterized protein n=1 Tax=Blastopirellula marina TaxID=124 RepID=A0A2S8G9F6_9BACT|nr:hypothetical protein [Blastopirellula marina]PQO40734.1 hypothetical protein C5Y98_05825 [Blastopirellula marina]PTL45694.1 hypothetical protein C5Y97_05825 [Blastopirellula marina]
MTASLSAGGVGSGLPGEAFAEQSQLKQGSIGIVKDIPLRERRRPNKHRIVLGKEGKVGRLRVG